MTLDPTQIERLAVLAGIRLDPDDAERLARELSAVLEEIAVLREMELSGDEDGDGDGDGDESSPPSSDGVPGPDPLEGDLSALAPDWREGFFLMPPPQAFRDGEGKEEDSTPGARLSEDPP